ncbi:nucleotidyltransferase domain-containing protein [Spirosoma sp. KUDC1026]|uniref:nucleotidyltransferase domain-containing protein n=1 Tax=Spirosoma sp. KUDC1026 TaxID=2745947 RepID=UPI00159BBF82|nr:nucleotidyltransferase domain-containing protein [Spirosoma sp. KUDC1026]QKZ11664.1 nucleotidyltransferase domain-containing protein [Spirosoma sp. KUDC1026]
MNDALFLQEVKRYINKVDPEAEIWLFGSRARGDARDDSDWDFLIFTQLDLSSGKRWVFSDQLTELELESGRVISPIVWPKHEQPRYAVTDLYKNVLDEGRRL